MFSSDKTHYFVISNERVFYILFLLHYALIVKYLY